MMYNWPCVLHTELFPPGVVNVVTGFGRDIMPPVMETGKIDVFAFIGTSRAASSMLKRHPKPHRYHTIQTIVSCSIVDIPLCFKWCLEQKQIVTRLRWCLGLEAKNPAIVLSDADLSVAVEECVLGVCLLLYT